MLKKVTWKWYLRVKTWQVLFWLTNRKCYHSVSRFFLKTTEESMAQKDKLTFMFVSFYLFIIILNHLSGLILMKDLISCSRFPVTYKLSWIMIWFPTKLKISRMIKFLTRYFSSCCRIKTFLAEYLVSCSLLVKIHQPKKNFYCIALSKQQEALVSRWMQIEESTCVLNKK